MLCARSGARLVHAEATGIDRAGRQVLLKDQPAARLRPAVGRCRLGAQCRGDRRRRAIGDPGQADRRAGTALARVQRAHEELAGTAQRHGDRRRRGRRRARPRDRPPAAPGRQGGEPAGHPRHQGRDPGRPGRSGAPPAARDLPAPRHPAARARRQPSASSAARSSSRTASGIRPTRCSSSPRRVPRHGSPTPACRSTSTASSPSTTRSPRPAMRESSPPATAPPCSTIAGPRPACSRCARVRRSPTICGACSVARPREPFVPQRRYLSILGTGDGRAVATRGDWAIEGRWVWWWKDHIDRKWMRMYR